MKKLLLLTSLLMVSFLVAGCGGGASTEITVDMMEFMFDPAEYTIPAGAEVTLTLVNNGAVAHEFVIMKYGTEVSVPFDDNDEDNIYWEKEVEPGATETVTFTAPTDIGMYQVVCGIPGHLEAGMVGSLTIVAP